MQLQKLFSGPSSPHQTQSERSHLQKSDLPVCQNRQDKGAIGRKRRSEGLGNLKSKVFHK